jgi:hypothetical protein
MALDAAVGTIWHTLPKRATSTEPWAVEGT